MDAVYDAAIHDALLARQGYSTITNLMDIKKCFEHVRGAGLIQQAEALHYPLQALAVSLR